MPTVEDIIDMIRVKPAKKFRLKEHDPAWAGDLDVPKQERKALAERILSEDVTALAEAQDLLYASDTYAILLVFQAMDAAGKDSTIKHVMSGVNPQGCQVFSFKAPSAEDLAHDFLWRTTRCLPERGRIGIFNRSYYEEVLVVRVHARLLDVQRLPPSVVSTRIWTERFEDINAFERHLFRSGVLVRKFFLHVSKKKQKERFLERIDTPSKNWKFSAHDVQERSCWRAYMAAYQDMIRHTATADSPWCVVPAGHKWFARLVVAGVVAETLAALDLQFPRLDRARRQELAVARATLERERG